MNLIRYIYPPTGRVIVEKKTLPFSFQQYTGKENGRSKIEIYNIHGNLVCVITDKKKIKLLKLQKGFYLLREKDITGKVISSGKMIF